MAAPSSSSWFVHPSADDVEVARAVAWEAGETLRGLRARTTARGAELGRRGDALAHRVIVAALRRLRPGDVVLSEEASDPAARVGAERVWIVDPLDGTREYGEAGRRDWAVHVALWSAGELVAGAVALPAWGEVVDTATVPPVPTEWPGGRVRLAVSRSRAPQVAHTVADRLDAELVPLGSAGYKILAVLRGEVDVYVHAGGQYEWDSAAPVAVARAAGLHTSRIDGQALHYNRPDPWLPDLVVCRPELARPVLDAVAVDVPEGGAA